MASQKKKTVRFAQAAAKNYVSAKRVKASDAEPSIGQSVDTTPTLTSVEGLADPHNENRMAEYGREMNKIARAVIEGSGNPNRVDADLGHSPAVVAAHAQQPLMTLADVAASAMRTSRR